MDELFAQTNKKKAYRGAYSYIRNETIYSEETFEVFRNPRELTVDFFSESHSRVATGELLSVKTIYIVGKNWIPKEVVIERSLGAENVTESYVYNTKSNALEYTFKSKDETEMCELSTPPKFHITTPTCTTSFLFILSKKFEVTAKNHYTLVTSPNQWSFVAPPSNKNVYLTKMNQMSETINIDGNQLSGDQYHLFEDNTNEKKSEAEPLRPPFVDLYISKYVGLPYMIIGSEGTKIQVKYLNNLEGE